MPQAVMIYIAEMALAEVLTQVAITIASSVAVSMVMGAMSSPESSDLATEAMGRKQTVRSPVEPRRVVYGETRISGPMVYAKTTNFMNSTLHMVIALHHGEVAEIGDVYLGDTLTTDDRFNLPTENAQRADITIGGSAPSSTPVTISVTGGVFVTATYQTSPAQLMSDLLDEFIALYPEWNPELIDSDTLRIQHPSVNVPFEVESPDLWPSLTLTVEKSTVAVNFPSMIHIGKHLGTADQEADADLVAAVTPEWTADHKLSGIAYLYGRIQWDTEAFPSGIQVLSAIVKGRKVYDPRTETTAWSDNFALCVLDYLIGTVPTAGGSEPIGVGATLAEVDVESFIAAANLCDEEVEVAAGGTEKRYTCNGSFTMDANPATVIEQLLPCGGAQLVFSAGKYRLYVGAYATPDLTITDDWLRGPVQLQPHANRRELFNAARGVYIDPGLAYEAVDFAPQVVPAYAQADGEVIYRDFRLAYVQSSATAQRLARLMIERTRRAAMLRLPCNYTAARCALWQTVTLDLSVLPGYQDTVWRVTGWTMAEGGGVDLTLQLEEAVAYAWSADQEKGGQAYMVPSLADIRDVAEPTGVLVASDPLVTADGMVIPRLRISWTAADDGNAVGYELQYKPSDEFFYLSGFPLGKVAVSWVAYLDAGVEYDVRLRTLSIHGTHSDWVEVLQTMAGAGDGADLLIDAGAAGSVYQVEQALDGGAANTVYSGSQVMDGGPA